MDSFDFVRLLTLEGHELWINVNEVVAVSEVRQRPKPQAGRSTVAGSEVWLRNRQGSYVVQGTPGSVLKTFAEALSPEVQQ